MAGLSLSALRGASELPPWRSSLVSRSKDAKIVVDRRKQSKLSRTRTAPRFPVMRSHIPGLLLVFVTALVAGAGACAPGADADGGTSPIQAGPACNLLEQCEGELTCCEGSCVDLSSNPSHCGACGERCSDQDGFCASGGSCAPVAWTSLCQNVNLLALRDGVSDDDVATEQLRDALAAECGVSAQTGATTDASLVGADGAPLVGVGTTVVTGGGGFFQRTVRYLEDTGRTPVYADQVNNGNTSRIVRRSNGEVIASVPSDISGEGRDYFVVYLAEDPAGGALMLPAYGFTRYGTRAAAWWFHNVLLADPGAFSSSWYLVEWTKDGQSGGPGADDSYEILASE
jgi:hypothetical protein